MACALFVKGAADVGIDRRGAIGEGFVAGACARWVAALTALSALLVVIEAGRAVQSPTAAP